MAMSQEQEKSQKEHCVVIVGAGFAGFNAARELSRLVGATTEIVLINSADYFLYVPLMPQVAGGLVRAAAHLCLAAPAAAADPVRARHRAPRRPGAEGGQLGRPEGASGQVRYDRLILTPGSVSKLLPIPGVAEYAHGFRSIAEAIYLRDHITRQLELAAVAADAAERQARCTFVVVGAGCTGTEVTAQGQLLTTRLAEDARPDRAADPVDAAGHRAAAAARARSAAVRRPPTGCCAGAASRCAPGNRSPKPWTGMCSCPPGRRCPPAR